MRLYIQPKYIYKIELNIFSFLLYNPLKYTIKMEKRLNQKVEQYVGKFKDDIRNKVVEFGLEEHERMSDLVEFIYEYGRLTIQKEDLSKRKRVKNSIPLENRCNANRADNDRCTRKRKDGHEYCGTHLKGTPNGCSSANNNPQNILKKIEVTVQDIDGILHYIDVFGNVYKAEDIMSNKENPQVIGKYSKVAGLALL